MFAISFLRFAAIIIASASAAIIAARFRHEFSAITLMIFAADFRH
jgi:hypothetical protein